MDEILLPHILFLLIIYSILVMRCLVSHFSFFSPFTSSYISSLSFLPHLFFLFNFLLLLLLSSAWRCVWGRGNSSGRGSSSRYSRHTRPSWRGAYGTTTLQLTKTLTDVHYKYIWNYSLSTLHLFDCLSCHFMFRHAPFHAIPYHLMLMFSLCLCSCDVWCVLLLIGCWLRQRIPQTHRAL